MSNNKYLFFIPKLHVWILALTIFFAVSMNYTWRSDYLIWYGSLLLVFGAYYLTFNGRMLLKNLSFLIWMFSFFSLGAVSILWCLSADMVIDIVKSFVVIFAVLLFIQCSLNYGFSIDTLLKIYFFATLINAGYIVLTVNIAHLGEIQLGTDLIEGWNGNGIGFLMSQGTLFGCYLYREANHSLTKAFYLMCIFILALLTIYTGSRTASLILIGELTLYFWLNHPTKIIRNILLSVIIVGTAFFLVMNIESFYNVLGVRLEGLFARFGGKGEIDSSTNMREIYIRNGIRWFSEQPIIGYGLNNYKVLNRIATRRFTYAHNNFVEIAVDLGVVGLVWYYSVYGYLISRFLKLIKNNHLSAFLLSALVASLVSQYGTVSYYDFYQNFLLLLCFFVMLQEERERTSIQS